MSIPLFLKRLDALVADGNLDVEDVELALRAIDGDGLDSAEAAAAHDALQRLADRMEPAARQYLEDRLAGRATQLVPRVLLAAVPAGKPVDTWQARSDVVRLQDGLKALGHDVTVDGVFGKGTAAAVRALQERVGLPASGAVDTETLVRMNLQLSAAGRPPVDLTPRARIRPDRVLAMKHGRNADDNRAVQQALSDLSAHYGAADLQVKVDGQYGGLTERAVAALQRRWYLPETGIVDDATVAAFNAALAVAGKGPLALKGGPALGRVELHFYPGDHELKVYVLQDGRPLDTYGMVGGRNDFLDDIHSEIDYSPTPEGRYDVVELSPHAASSWSWSYVPYGADLQMVDGEVQFRDGSGQWKWATGPRGVFVGRNPTPLSAAEYLDDDGRLPPTYVLNDFGHLRGRLRSRRTGRVLTHMVHSSPDQEKTAVYFGETDRLLEPGQAIARLRHSHGCAHIHPRDVDEMVAKGYLAPGCTFVVHGYEESFVA